MPSCYICAAREAEWVHRLDPQKQSFRQYGKGYTFGGRVDFCDRCEDLYNRGADEALIELAARARELVDPAAVDEEIRNPLAVLRAADLGAVRLDDLLPPGVAELRAAGFTPIEFLTGSVDVVHGWPDEHRRSVPETRPDWQDEDDQQCWLVRSPWPSVDVDEVFELMWPWVEERAPFRPANRHAARIGPDDHRSRQAAVAAFLALPEQDVLALRDADSGGQSDLPPL